VIISQLTPRYNTVIGIIFLAVILLTPNGILGLVEDLRRGSGWRTLQKRWAQAPRTEER